MEEMSGFMSLLDKVKSFTTKILSLPLEMMTVNSPQLLRLSVCLSSL